MANYCVHTPAYPHRTTSSLRLSYSPFFYDEEVSPALGRHRKRFARWKQSPINQLYCYFLRACNGIFTVWFWSIMTLCAAFSYGFSSLGHIAGPKRTFKVIEEQRARLRSPQERHLTFDIDYYASLVGLRVDQYEIVTADGFLISLQHIREYGDAITASDTEQGSPSQNRARPKKKFPVMLLHGLLQSSGAFCVDDQSSLAFYLCKSGYDVWLANNRCGLHPRHLKYHFNDPRLWDWDITDMALYDLPALVDFVLLSTHSSKLGLVCHSQGTAETFLALSKNYIPSLSTKVSCFCALSPAVFAAPLVQKPYFRFLHSLPRVVFDLIIGIHAFMPLLMFLRRHLPKRVLGFCSYLMLEFMFSWTDARWDRGLRSRHFMASPVYISAKLMHWWLGPGGFVDTGSVFSDLGPDENWFHPQYPPPPIGLWYGAGDHLVDGSRLSRELKVRHAKNVRVLKDHKIPDYNHVDVLWAIDSVDIVGKEVKELIWKTIEDKELYRTVKI